MLFSPVRHVLYSPALVTSPSHPASSEWSPPPPPPPLAAAARFSKDPPSGWLGLTELSRSSPSRRLLPQTRLTPLLTLLPPSLTLLSLLATLPPFHPPNPPLQPAPLTWTPSSTTLSTLCSTVPPHPHPPPPPTRETPSPSPPSSPRRSLMAPPGSRLTALQDSKRTRPRRTSPPRLLRRMRPKRLRSLLR